MAGVEVLAGLGLLATELFKYNRENYEFDQDQRFEREECRLKMQVERFSLFREDIRDLVELTVKKMDLYHLVGALFLKMIVLYYCVGFFVRPAPPFLLCLYYLSNGSAWVFLMLAIWLAMHASISSHSYGTRLLTRFVRLPIPGSAQLNVLNARYADFEKQGFQMWRVPFMNKKANTWRQRNALGSFSDDQAPQHQALHSPRTTAPKGDKAKGNGSHETGSWAVAGAEDWLGTGEYAYGGGDDIAGREGEMLRAVEFRTHRHVQLFRQLQSQWQCYDAYARVAMSLGVREMIQSLAYYMIGICLVDQQAPFVAYVLVLALQALAMSIYVLDIHGLPCYGNMDLSIVGAAPTIIAVIQLSMGRRDAEGYLTNDNLYRIACACFPLEICWMHLSVWAASPTDRENGLPRHFRSVLFMDVFAEVDDPGSMDPATGKRKLNERERSLLERATEAADSALYDANAALRRWEAVSAECLSQEQQKMLRHASKEVSYWVSALSRELELRKVHGLHDEQKHRRPWQELSIAEREDDPFMGSILGPFAQFTGMGLETRYYYDPETNEYLHEPLPGDRRVFSLGQVVEVVRGFASEVEGVCALAGNKREKGGPKGKDVDSGDESEENTPLARAHSQSTLSSSKRKEDKGDDEGKLRPNRLPWQLVNLTTRAIQLVWTYVFIMFVLHATDYYICDWQGPPEPDEVVRRLAALPPAVGEELRLEHQAVDWPAAAFFRTAGLSCLPGRGDPEAAPRGLGEVGEVLLRSPYSVYRLAGATGSELEELPASDVAPGAVAVCGAPGAVATAGCLQAALTEEGVAVWPWGQDLRDSRPWTFATEGPPWRQLAGAILPCATTGNHAVLGSSAVNGTASQDCLLLAGAAPGRQVRVVFVPLPAFLLEPGRPDGEPGRGGAKQVEISLELEVPPVGPAAAEIQALAASPGGARLQAVTADGVLTTWSLLQGLVQQHLLQGLGDPHRRLEVTGLCEDQASGHLLLAAMAPGSRQPALLRAERALSL